MNKPLITDEVLALQYFGIFHSKILKMHLDKFEKLLDENPRLEYCLVKANAVLDRQEAARVISYVWSDSEFPDRLRRIGGGLSSNNPSERLTDSPISRRLETSDS